MSSNVNTKAMKTCLEWYKLEDGETRPEKVNKSYNTALKDIKGKDKPFIQFKHQFMCHISMCCIC